MIGINMQEVLTVDLLQDDFIDVSQDMCNCPMIAEVIEPYDVNIDWDIVYKEDIVFVLPNKKKKRSWKNEQHVHEVLCPNGRIALLFSEFMKEF